MHAQTTAPLDLASLLPGFPDPAKDSQSSFRAIMTATAQPGTMATFDHAPTPPEGLTAAAGVYLLALADQDTKLWLGSDVQNPGMMAWLRFHTGAHFTSLAGEATFALVTARTEDHDLARFHQGDTKYPDLATTVIIMVPSLNDGPELSLEGPGIQTNKSIAPSGLTQAFWQARAELVSHFQFGIDLVLCADNQLICIPRTTRVAF